MADYGETLAKLDSKREQREEIVNNLEKLVNRSTREGRDMFPDEQVKFEKGADEARKVAVLDPPRARRGPPRA